MHKVDLSSFDLRTDLIIEQSIKSKSNKYEENGILVEDIVIKKNKMKKKADKYITISFKDITDTENYHNVLNVFKKELLNVMKYLNIKDNESCLIIGLGNSKIISDALGSKSIDNVIVTRHLYLLGDVDTKYRNVSILEPRVMGVTGIDSYEIIKNTIKEIKPDFIMTIDSLCAADIRRLNKTIQITTAGITPGSGIGNSRKELSFDTLGVKVIAIGVPTVVDSSVIVSNTIKYFLKKIGYLKYNSKLTNKLRPIDKINYLDKEYELEDYEKKEILGYLGLLKESEIKSLVWEILSPLESNMIVTVKEIDFILEKLSHLISEGINKTIHHID